MQDYDWLGTGRYFWENDIVRAYQWAIEPRRNFTYSSVVGAVIELGNCLDLTTQTGIDTVKLAYGQFIRMVKENGETIPENVSPCKESNGDKIIRRLDCAVINHFKEIRFRLHGSALWPLIEFESRSTICPKGSPYGSNCNVVKTDFEPVQLIGEDKKLIPGFVLISWSGKPPQKDMAAMMLYYSHCTPYSWDEAAFAYVPSPLKPVACGIPSKPASSQRSQTPHGAKPSLHK